MKGLSKAVVMVLSVVLFAGCSNQLMGPEDQSAVQPQTAQRSHAEGLPDLVPVDSSFGVAHGIPYTGAYALPPWKAPLSDSMTITFPCVNANLGKGVFTAVDTLNGHFIYVKWAHVDLATDRLDACGEWWKDDYDPSSICIPGLDCGMRSEYGQIATNSYDVYYVTPTNIRPGFTLFYEEINAAGRYFESDRTNDEIYYGLEVIANPDTTSGYRYIGVASNYWISQKLMSRLKTMK